MGCGCNETKRATPQEGTMATTESASVSGSGRIAPHRATRTPAGVAPVRSRRREARRAQAAGEPPVASAETPTEPLHHPSELIATPVAPVAPVAAVAAVAPPKRGAKKSTRTK